MGRRKIEIQPLTDDRNRTVTFVKRKAGLFKKAHELAVLCQVDLAVIIVGNNNKLYEFSSVDTNELINMYKRIPKPHESKSPANYGKYKKKKHLTARNIGVINDDVDDIDDIDHNSDDNSDYDSDSPEPKRQKRSFKDMTTSHNNHNNQNQGQNLGNGSGVVRGTRSRPVPPNHISLGNVPTFNSFPNNVIKEEEEDDGMPKYHGSNSRPILRVQIPTDAKGSNNDSARTLTAMDTNLHTNTNNNKDNDSDSEKSNNSIKNSGDSSNGGPNLNTLTPKYSSFNTFRSPATSKPITQLPIPIHSKSQTSSPSSATAPQLPNNTNMTPFFNILPQPSPSSQFPNSSIQTPIYYQMMFNGDPKFRNFQQHNGQQVLQPPNQPPGSQSQSQNQSQAQSQSQPGSNGGSDAPMSGLPSRYINDMFPSPSAFYVSQDWPNSGTGMTPLHNNVPQYFNMMPNQRGKPQTQPHPSGTPPNQPQSSQQPPHLPLPPPGQNYSLPSPLQFSGPTFQQEKK